MTPNVRAALEALVRRIEHVEATATLIARQFDDRVTRNALDGVCHSLDVLSIELDRIINPAVRRG